MTIVGRNTIIKTVEYFKKHAQLHTA